MVADILASYQNVSDISDVNILGGLVFTNLDLQNITYKIRLTSAGRNSGGPSLFGGSGSWKTKLMFPQFQTLGPREPGDSHGGSPGTGTILSTCNRDTCTCMLII